MRAARVLGAAAAGALLLPAGTTYAADDDEGADCTQLDANVGRVSAGRTSLPMDELGIADAHRALARRGLDPGQGVVVAVLDSGVATSADVALAGDQALVAGARGTSFYHGTAVAGLIAGRPTADGSSDAQEEDGGALVGVAPAARILDVKVYDDDAGPDSDSAQVTPDAVVDGLREVRSRLATMPQIKVVNLSLLVAPDQRIQAEIDKLWDAGVVVVAPTGDRPAESTDPLYDEFPEQHAGEDAVDDAFPAGYDHVVAVGASAEGVPGAETDPTPYVLANSATDVAAPTANAVTYAFTGGTCTLTDPSTDWAAAEVSGVLALLRSAYDENPAQAVARLVQTADGRPDIPNVLAGAGVVQPLEALTRPLALRPDGTLDQPRSRDTAQRAQLPEKEPDLLASTRRDAVWWGLVGGGALVLALVLRPVLARRRR